ncbi:MAG: TonB C-terminal domain-containing protein [Betaproteobacteria bacterium]
MLFLAIAFVVRWKTEPAGPVSAELWGGLPPMVEPAPAPSPPPPPPVKVERAPEPEPAKPDIVMEQKKPEPRPEKKPEPVKKTEPVKKAEPDPKVEQRKREEEAKAAKAAQAAEAAAQKQREAAIQRALAAAGGSATSAASGGVAAGSPSMSDSYKGQVVSCIRPHVVFSVPEGLRPKQHVAEFEVQLLPSGEQVGAPRLVSASGLPAYDQAVERAIRRCDPFPRPREGSMPRSVRLSFDPVELR